MALIAAVHHVPTLTQGRYDEVIRRLTGGKSRLDSLADLPFEGVLVHVAGQAEDGFWIFDVFESAEAVERFASVMTPIAQAVGIEEPPTFFPAHTVAVAPAGD